MKTRVLLLALALAATPALADERVEICYNYGCAQTATISFSEDQLERVRQWMALREEGATWSDIARQYGCQPENVLLLCQRWGKLAEESDEF